MSIHTPEDMGEAIAAERAAIENAARELGTGPRCATDCLCQCHKTTCACFDALRPSPYADDVDVPMSDEVRERVGA